MPVSYGLPVLGVLRPRRVGQFDEPVPRLRDEPLADLPPQRHQVALRLALVHREEHVRVVERTYGFRRHIIGVACPDTDDVDQPHKRKRKGTDSLRLHSKYPVPRVLTSFGWPLYL